MKTEYNSPIKNSGLSTETLDRVNELSDRIHRECKVNESHAKYKTYVNEWESYISIEFVFPKWVDIKWSEWVD